MPQGPTSAGEVLQLFREGRATTRADVQQHTGMARSTVSHKIDSLLSSGYLVRDGDIIDGRGRPSTRLRINDQGTTVLAADLGAKHGRLAVATTGGDVLAEAVIESTIERGPTVVLRKVLKILDELLSRSGRERSSVRGIGLGVPGPVNPQTGRVARSMSMPGWDDYPLREHLIEHTQVAAVVDNDANLLGCGEQRRIYPDAHLMLFIKMGTGIGASVIIDGELLRGSASAEGDIGHAKIPGVEETCSCGARGCLAATASGRAMVRDLQRLGHQPRTTRDVVNLVRAGEPAAVRIVAAAGRALGDVLCTAVSLLNPDVVVVGGDIAHAHEPFMQGVREILLSRSQPLATARLSIAPTTLGDRAGIAGAAVMVSDAIFSAKAVNAALE
jgi:predicted NBD/HSP70 family sugar kinase